MFRATRCWWWGWCLLLRTHLSCRRRRLIILAVTAPQVTSAVHEHNRNLGMAFVRAFGEELGWRAYLLPRLVQHFSGGDKPTQSSCVCGAWLVLPVVHAPV